MQTCSDCMKYRRARSARGLRRLLARLGVFAIALVIVAVILFGQRWVLARGPASVIELGMAAHAAEALRIN